MHESLAKRAVTAGGPYRVLYRDIGLATVATELNLQPDTLEPDVAEAVEREEPPRFSWRGSARV